MTKEVSSILSLRRKFLQAGKFALMTRISVYFLNIWPLYRLKSLNIQPLKGQIWSWCLGYIFIYQVECVFLESDFQFILYLSNCFDNCCHPSRHASQPGKM